MICFLDSCRMRIGRQQRPHAICNCWWLAVAAHCYSPISMSGPKSQRVVFSFSSSHYCPVTIISHSIGYMLWTDNQDHIKSSCVQSYCSMTTLSIDQASCQVLRDLFRTGNLSKIQRMQAAAKEKEEHLLLGPRKSTTSQKSDAFGKLLNLTHDITNNCISMAHMFSRIWNAPLPFVNFSTAIAMEKAQRRCSDDNMGHGSMHRVTYEICHP